MVRGVQEKGRVIRRGKSKPPMVRGVQEKGRIICR